MIAGKRILLIVSGGIAAYKCLELIRRLKERGANVRCVLTAGGAQFVAPLSLSALSEDKVYTEIFSLTDEAEMGHIQLSRDADLLVVAPASADIMARMAGGLANDLATTVLLATDKPVMFVPAMNVRMWEHPATQANIETLESRGLTRIGPNSGNMACGEYGLGRMSEPLEVVEAIEGFFAGMRRPLLGRRALVTSGPTREAIDPVRYLSNHSSGKQGHAIATALAGLGAETSLITGPVALADPSGVNVLHVESAAEMLSACQAALPADIAVCAAAVSDWRVADAAPEKLKKDGSGPPPLALTESPDILQTLSKAENRRPGLVVGFAAETENVVQNAIDKRIRKGCDWILANDVSPETGTFGGDSNTIHLVHDKGVEDWPRLTKQEVADRLSSRIADYVGEAE
ncbi:MAG: bifunctional phosphopantothenoylcysteine decarboxylase/phosphopantothenate--cysteine ligase CoaBC [Pseudomonadota bacterium]|nr:bifunctional phosphopantothenoylcysteine decarboxylase/phosphopantothenate--cysteine ligase CoaBC [Pseudomonadota bacterium]MEE3092561.1 bifunctional phosphopantothenoylcysteine decarboxylase/phosphopantothenate--cysteine ligase CoaBC [Pseudomonadota bacterium]